MIVGKGMLAKSFEKYKNNSDIVIFASGVSNSKETEKINFDREKNLLIDTIKKNQNKLLVYFSTCSIDDNSQKNSHYVIHKTDMENLIQAKCEKYYIFRLPQVVGTTDSPTLINFLIDSIQNNKFFNIQKNATRNIIDVNDVFNICSKIINEKKYMNEITNIASKYNVKVIDIVNILEDILGKKAKFKFIEQGTEQNINIDKIKFIVKDIFCKEYLKNILLKKVQNI